MGRAREYFRYETPKGVVELVTAIIADGKRREMAIRRGSITGEVLAEYIRLQNAVEGAISKIEVGLREAMLSDIAEGRGYGRSSLQCAVSKNAYYRRRRMVIYEVASRLSLI